MFRLDNPPLQPDASTARSWLQEEISSGRYRTQMGWRERIQQWLSDLLANTRAAALDAPGWLMPLILIAIALIAAFVIRRIVVRDRTSPSNRPSSVVFGDEPLSARDYHARAQTSWEQGRFDDALLDAYRAVAAAAVERTVLTDLPGRTAHEVAVELSPVFPDQAQALVSVAQDFDAIRYGDLHRGQDAAQRALDVEAAVGSARPVR